MPETANPWLDATIFESEMPHLVRTFLSLLILSLKTIDSLVVAEVVVDVWYSVKWSQWAYSYLERYVGQLLRDSLRKIQVWYEDKQDRLTECYKLSLGTP